MAHVIQCDGCAQQKTLQQGFFVASLPGSALPLQLHACSTACKATVESNHNVTMTPC